MISSLFEMYDVYVLSPINYLVNFPYNFIFYNEVRAFDFTFYSRKCWQWRVPVRYTWMPQKQTQMWHHLDEQGSTGVKRSRITRSPIMQYFKLMHDRTYSCEICRQKYPDDMQGVIKHPTDGSTNVFWKHFKAVHRRLYDALKGFGDAHGGQQCVITEGADGQLKIEAPKKQPMGGLTPDETKDVIARFMCLTDSPWSIVDHKAFKELWRYATQIEVDPPSAKVIKSWTIKMHQRMKETIATGYTSVHHVMLTTDAWTSENGCGLLGVTAQWIDATWE